MPLGKFDIIFMAALHLKVTVKHSIIYTLTNQTSIMLDLDIVYEQYIIYLGISWVITWLEAGDIIVDILTL